jgi:hypothetical protein
MPVQYVRPVMPVQYVGPVMPVPISHTVNNGPHMQSWTAQLENEKRIHEQLILEQRELHKKIRVLSVELHNAGHENSLLASSYSNTNVHETFNLNQTTLEFNDMTLSNPSAYLALKNEVETWHTANENIGRKNVELASVLQKMGLNCHALRAKNKKLRELLLERNVLKQRLIDAEQQWGQKQRDERYPKSIEKLKSGENKRTWALNTLGLQGEPSETEITRAFKTLALKFHPDKTPGCEDEMTEKFKLINEARAYLKNPFLVHLEEDGCVRTAVPRAWLFTAGKNK